MPIASAPPREEIEVPPSMVHVNGSVNLPDAEAVMRELATRIPRLRRLPDGETGERKIWLGFQGPKFEAAAGLETAPRPEGSRPGEIDEQQVHLGEGVDPMAIEWPDLGYAAHYLESYDVFDRLSREGVIPVGMRFQVQYPTPLAAVTTYVERRDALRVHPSYERALFADLDRLLAAVPCDRIAVQFDLPVEMGVLEMPEAFAVSERQTVAVVAEGIARCVDHVPAEVPAGLHLCYGDYQHRHWKEPTSLDMQVRLLNAVNATARREVSWCSFTVPQYVQAPEYFAPLADLDAAQTELYLALVPYHPGEQPPGTTAEQVGLVDQHLGTREWGICTECGLVNVDRDELPALLDLHSELLGRFALA